MTCSKCFRGNFFYESKEFLQRRIEIHKYSQKALRCAALPCFALLCNTSTHALLYV